MNEEYAQGVLQSLGELISAGVPEAARRQIGSPLTQEGASDAKRTNLKAVSDEKPEQLSYTRVDNLASALSIELMEEEEACNLVMILMQEIAEHPFDNSHVETIANLVNTHLFARSRQADKAFKQFMDAERRKLTKGSQS
jgi:hypothetical protein